MSKVGIAKVKPVINKKVRGLCKKAYYNHPNGCPNFNKKKTCPPKAKFIEDIIDLSKSVFCVFNRFNLEEHVERLREKHPQWTYRQLSCCLYWQGRARKQLREGVNKFMKGKRMIVLYTPEACGVDITATMKLIGIELEWPPKRFTYQVALVGIKR